MIRSSSSIRRNRRPRFAAALAIACGISCAGAAPDAPPSPGAVVGADYREPSADDEMIDWLDRTIGPDAKPPE